MCNAAFETMYGYREADISGMDIEPLIIPPDRAVEAADLSRRAFAGQSARLVTERRRKDGSLIHVEVTIVPLTADGLPTGAYAIYRDLTEQRRAEHHLRAQYAVIEVLVTKTRSMPL